MSLNSFQVQGNFEASASTADILTTQITAVDDLSTDSPGEPPAVLYQRDAAGRHRCHHGGGKAVWPLNPEAALVAGKPPLNSVGSAYAETHMESGGSHEAHVLIEHIFCNLSQTTRVMGLSGEDAQHMVDFLDTELRESGGLRTNEGKSLLYLLRGLTKSAQVFPQCYKLKKLRCDFSQPREGGTFADIYEGEYEGRKICLKAARIFGEKDSSQMQRAHMKELILWAHLSHPNVLPFYGVYGHDRRSQRRCIVAPWMHNGNLSGYLVAFPRSPRLALVSDIAAGLAYLHQMEVVHGDLKANNVLISDDGRALLADFGISRIVTSAQLASTRLSNGTMRWMAPELLLDHSGTFSPTFESDIWSFGCLCYEVFTRKVPFYQHIHEAQLLLAIFNREIPTRLGGNQFDSIDDQMWDLMKRCWEYDPRNRPHCGEIRQFIADIASLDTRHGQLPLLLDLETPPSCTSIRNKSKTTVDRDRIDRILLGILQDPPPVLATHPRIKFKSTRWSLAGLLVGVDPETSPMSLGFFGRVLRKIREKYASI